MAAHLLVALQRQLPAALGQHALLLYLSPHVVHGPGLPHLRADGHGQVAWLGRPGLGHSAARLLAGRWRSGRPAAQALAGGLQHAGDGGDFAGHGGADPDRRHQRLADLRPGPRLRHRLRLLCPRPASLDPRAGESGSTDERRGAEQLGLHRHPVLPVLLVMGFVPIVVGMPYRTLFPVFAREVYGVGSVGLGVMGLATGLGALVGSLGVASLAPGSRRSAIPVVAGLGFGVTLIAFAAAPALALGLVALLFVGLMSNSYWALNGTMVLASSDPEYYGRVQSIYMLSWSVQAFAGLPIGALADLLGVQTTVAVALAAIVALFPGHRRLREHEANRVQPARAQ